MRRCGKAYGDAEVSILTLVKPFALSSRKIHAVSDLFSNDNSKYFALPRCGSNPAGLLDDGSAHKTATQKFQHENLSVS